jgi:RNA polymerase sigma factor (sigma-70 family)
MVNLFVWALSVTLGLAGLFIVRLYMRAKLKKEMMAREAMSMSMMDIDTMRKRGLVSEAEYKAIRHALAEREVEKDRRRKQAERERTILHLRFFEGLTQSQIAQQVGISQMHVSRLIRRSLEKIREEIAADQPA